MTLRLVGAGRRRGACYACGMKPTRKRRPSSFISQVAGGHRGGAFTKLAGPGREEFENDHDAPHPAQGKGAAPDHDG